MIFQGESSLTTEAFLNRYWQKKPCLIRQAMTGFEPDLDGDDLAGLACDEMADSRLISGNHASGDWKVSYGPFSESDFARLGEKDWTLLVQDVEKHYAPLQDLMQQFNFIPDWRLDDLMISYAATGGSVGPHVDQYDVFLLQVEGKRRWQIARSFDPSLLEDCPLNVLEHFEVEQEWVLEPGDILYLPPNVAHFGIALEPGMTWSIGSRAPSAADLLQGYGEWLVREHEGGERYSDPGLRIAERAGEVSLGALKDLRDLMRSQITDSHDIDEYLTAFLSRFRLAREPMAPDVQVSCEELIVSLEQGAQLIRHPWTRLSWYETPQGARLFAAGQGLDCDIRLAVLLCDTPQPLIEPASLDQRSIAMLTQLVNNGHFALLPAS